MSRTSILGLYFHHRGNTLLLSHQSQTSHLDSSLQLRSANLLGLDQRPKRIPQLLQRNIRQFLPTHARNIPVPHRVRRQHHIQPPLRRRPRRRRHTHVRHIPDQHDLLARLPQPLQILIQVRVGKAARVVLRDDLLALLGREFLEFFREGRVGREDGRAFGRGVDDVDDVFAVEGRGAVLGEQGGNGGARGGYVLGLEGAVGVSVVGGRMLVGCWWKGMGDRGKGSCLWWLGWKGGGR